METHDIKLKAYERKHGDANKHGNYHFHKVLFKDSLEFYPLLSQPQSSYIPAEAKSGLGLNSVMLELGLRIAKFLETDCRAIGVSFNQFIREIWKPNRKLQRVNKSIQMSS